jgi:hypothetical protein
LEEQVRDRRAPREQECNEQDRKVDLTYS